MIYCIYLRSVTSNGLKECKKFVSQANFWKSFKVLGYDKKSQLNFDICIFVLVTYTYMYMVKIFKELIMFQKFFLSAFMP